MYYSTSSPKKKKPRKPSRSLKVAELSADSTKWLEANKSKIPAEIRDLRFAGKPVLGGKVFERAQNEGRADVFSEDHDDIFDFWDDDDSHPSDEEWKFLELSSLYRLRKTDRRRLKYYRAKGLLEKAAETALRIRDIGKWITEIISGKRADTAGDDRDQLLTAYQRKVLDLRRTGLSQVKIAEKLKVSRSAVSQILAKISKSHPTATAKLIDPKEVTIKRQVVDLKPRRRPKGTKIAKRGAFIAGKAGPGT